MIIDLIKLGKASFDFEFSPDSSEINLEGDIARLKKTITAKGKLTGRIAQTDVEGMISAEIEIDCTRCLQPVEKKLDISFNAVFITPENYSEERELELRSDDLDVSILEDDKIDLTELVREQILLNVPTQFFCRENCQGLCENCGANLNLTKCNCKDDEIDPRWQGLRELKFKK